MSLVTSTPTKIYRATMPGVIKSRSDGWKLASYEVAGIIAGKIYVLKGRRNPAAHFHRPFRTILFWTANPARVPG
jgi:hypothetical protein